MRVLVLIAMLAACGGGEGGALVSGLVTLEGVECEITSPTSAAMTGSIDVFGQDGDTVIVSANAPDFPQDGGSITTTVFECDGWTADNRGCVAQPGAPSRATMTFEHTVEIAFDTLEPGLIVSVSAIMFGNGDDFGTEDFVDVTCR
jgi:hypothetical protein